ncbi:MAG: hypothetical protein ACW981_11515 [Candidatus Hodarchaeales archaeon]|jgi:hypothetical protein
MKLKPILILIIFFSLFYTHLNWNYSQELNSDIPIVRAENGNGESLEIWNRTYGGRGFDGATSLLETSDGGFLLTGFTTSYGSGGKDVWLIKTDNIGFQQWNQTFGSTMDDASSKIIETSDGGYVLSGYTKREESLSGTGEMWLIKLNSTGDKQWDNIFGGRKGEEASSVIETSDGGFLLVGSSSSVGPQVIDNVLAVTDIFIVKTDVNGSEQWENNFGTINFEYANAVIETSDGGYLIAGSGVSFSGFDIWLIKTDNLGQLLWAQTFGGSAGEQASSLIETSDGGYIISGMTGSYGSSSLDNDMWLIKTDFDGNKKWDQTFGGPGDDGTTSVVETADQGFLLLGWTTKIESGISNQDVLLIKTDINGTQLWNQTYGGEKRDFASTIIKLSDGNFLIGGETNSFGSDLNNGDIWLLKIKNPDNQRSISGFFAYSSIIAFLLIVILRRFYGKEA